MLIVLYCASVDTDAERSGGLSPPTHLSAASLRESFLLCTMLDIQNPRCLPQCNIMHSELRQHTL